MEMVNFNFNGNDVTTYVDDDNKIWFAAAHIKEILKYTNTTMMIKNHCKQKGIISHYTLTMGGKQNIKFIDEPNLYRVIFGAKVENAAMFQDWVFEEVLPTIRKTGKYVIDNNSFTKHIDKNVQIENSKKVNSYKYLEGGVDDIIKYNSENCKIHSGMTTREVKEKGLESGLKKSECQSAKAVLRKINPEIACSMSFADSLTQQGYDLDLVSPITRDAIELYNKLIKIGYKPIELQEQNK